MAANRDRTGFTIVELLIVVCLIAIGLGLALPALGRVRSMSMTDVSMANLATLGIAHNLYAADWNGRQYTNVIDDLSWYGPSVYHAFTNYEAAHGGCGWIHDPGCHPPILLGWCDGGMWGYWPAPPTTGNRYRMTPINFGTSGGPGSLEYWGLFRVPNAKPLHDYVDGRFFSPTYYAPNDTVPWEEASQYFDEPCEFVVPPPGSDTPWSSYCFSPAAMFDPAVFRAPSAGGWQDPWTINEAFTSPPLAAALYPDLKTHIMEHHWLLDPPADCNPYFSQGCYDCCEPYHFNHGINSTPATLFYDGSTRLLPNMEVQASDQTILKQTGGVDGLWSRDTPWGNDGYFLSASFDGIVDVSHHILTTGGILGRDTLGAGLFDYFEPGKPRKRAARRPADPTPDAGFDFGIERQPQ